MTPVAKRSSVGLQVPESLHVCSLFSPLSKVHNMFRSTTSTALTPTTVFSNSGRPMCQRKAPARESVTLIKTPKKAEKGGYGASDLRRAEENINAIEDMKIDDPLEELLRQDPLSIRTRTLKRGESTSAVLDSQAVMTILGPVSTTSETKSRGGENLIPVSSCSMKPRGASRRAGVRRGVKFVTADVSDAAFTRFTRLCESRNTKRVIRAPSLCPHPADGGADADPTPIVFIHGFLYSSSSFTPILSHLSARTRVIFDLEGRGQSTLESMASWSLDSAVSTIVLVLSHFGYPPGTQVDVVAHSQGGISLAVLFSQSANPSISYKVRHLVLMGPADPAEPQRWRSPLREEQVPEETEVDYPADSLNYHDSGEFTGERRRRRRVYGVEHPSAQRN